MPYCKQSKHFNEVKRCPECRNDSMRFIEGMESWICKVCSNAVREDFYQIVLPSSRELETDEIAPDQSTTGQQRTPLYIKSIKAGDTEQDYEASVNRGSFGAAGNENKDRILLSIRMNVGVQPNIIDNNAANYLVLVSVWMWIVRRI
jgi:hypothetical protein